MRESVLLDLRGEMYVDFHPDHFVYVRQDYAAYRLPSRIRGKRVVANEPMSYSEIEWVGCILRRQWFLLIPGIFFVLMGPIWMAGSWKDWGTFTVSVIWFFLLGIIPILLVVRGRPYLGIATCDNITVFPMDRKRKKVARILSLIRQACPSPHVSWNLAGTSFANEASWDHAAPTGKTFDQRRYLRFSALLAGYGAANLMVNLPGYRNAGLVLMALVAIVGTYWLVLGVIRKIRRR